MKFLKIVVGFGLLLLTLTLGYYAKHNEWGIINNFYIKVENKINKLFDLPSELEKHIASINTVHLAMRGRLYEMPNNHWEKGGALTLWKNDILVINNLGYVYYLDRKKNALNKLGIEPPSNGRAEYEAISKTDKYVNYTHKPETMRFNDIKYIHYGEYNRLVLSYTYFDANKECFGTRISYVDLDDVNNVSNINVSSADWKVLFDTKPCILLDPDWTALDGIVAGGRIRFYAPNSIILGSGEYHHDGSHTYDIGTQSDEVDYGKVLKINLDTGKSTTVAKGVRNPQGLAIDDRKRVWTTEHGIRGGDELNLIKDGGNYGWPLNTLGTLYSGLPIPVALEYGRHNDFQKPAYAWMPSAGISSLEFINGIDTSWDGDFLAGSLSSKEYGKSLFRIRIDNERVVFVERIYIGARVRYVLQTGPKEIAVWTDLNQLIIFTMTRPEDGLAKSKLLLSKQYSEEVASKTLNRLTQCSQCHSFKQFEHQVGPSLNGVFEREIARSSFSSYSDSLKSVGGKWTEENLRSFLKDTQKFSKGSTMPSQNITNENELEALIFVLKNTKPEKDELFYD